MTKEWSPTRWAIELTKLLDQVHGDSATRFPVDVQLISREWSRVKFPDDPIAHVASMSMKGFEGALFKAPAGEQGWAIMYNGSITSKGRINFTLGHEFGHYLLHRQAYPDGIRCDQQDILRWDEFRQIEQQANEFSAGLLMPLNDFRSQISDKAKPTLDDIGACADRYGVSLIAATLRWLGYTQRRSVMVVSRDGYILWARSSDRALRTGAYFRTSGRPPIPVPDTSLAAQTGLLANGKLSVAHGEEIWFAEPCEEIALQSDQYDFAISLLHLEKEEWREWDAEAAGLDAYEFMMARRAY